MYRHIRSPQIKKKPIVERGNSTASYSFSVFVQKERREKTLLNHGYSSNWWKFGPSVQTQILHRSTSYLFYGTNSFEDRNLGRSICLSFLCSWSVDATIAETISLFKILLVSLNSIVIKPSLLCIFLRNPSWNVQYELHVSANHRRNPISYLCMCKGNLRGNH